MPKRKEENSDSDEYRDTKKQKAASGVPERKDWTKEEELALLRAVFETALTMVPVLHEKSGLKGKRGNPSINTKLRQYLKGYEKTLGGA